MTEVAPRASNAVQAVRSDGFTPTPALKSLFWMADGNTPILPRQMTPELRTEADSFLRLKTHMQRPPSPQRIMEWCNVLREYVQDGPKTDQEMAEYARVLFEVCPDVPPLFWTRATALAWVRREPIGNRMVPGRFWPKPAEVYALLSERKNALSWAIMRVERLMRHIERQKREASEPVRRRPTDAEKAAVRAALQEFRDSLPPDDAD